MALPSPRPSLLDMKPYTNRVGSHHALTGLVRLSSNENFLGSSPKAREAYSRVSEALHRYPDAACEDLRAALAREYGMKAESIVCGAGSDELISLIIRAYAGAGDELVHSQYGFLMYSINAKAAGAKAVSAPERNMRSDIESLLAAVTAKTKVMMLANPNNPTGSYLTRRELKELRERLAENILLVIDAAYAEYVDDADYEDGRVLVDSHPNVVMLRTFSKIHGLAGLRLGWGYFPAEVAEIVNRVRGPFNVSAPAQAAGIAALADKDFIEHSLALTRQGRSYLSGKLQERGMKVYPSVGNFLLTDCGPKAEEVCTALKERGILVQYMGAYDLPHCFRVTVGSAADNERFIATLDKVYSPS